MSLSDWGFDGLYESEVRCWMSNNESRFDTVLEFVEGARRHFRWKFFVNNTNSLWCIGKRKDDVFRAHAEVRVEIKRNEDEYRCPRCKGEHYYFRIDDVEPGRILLDCHDIGCDHQWKKAVYLIGNKRRQTEAEEQQASESGSDSSLRNYYLILGIEERTASLRVVEEAYDRAKRSNDPDRAKEDPYVAARLKAIEEAYAKLRETHRD